MSPEPPLPELEPLTEIAPAPSYPFWGYLDLLGFVLIALLGSRAVSLLGSALIDVTHIKKAFVLFPTQILLYAFLLGALPSLPGFLVTVNVLEAGPVRLLVPVSLKV